MSILKRCTSGAYISALTLVTALVVGSLAVISPAAQAAHTNGPLVTGQSMGGNPTCSQFYNDPDMIEFKYEPVVTANNVGDGMLSVDIVVSGKSFSWEASGGTILGIFSKGGPGGKLYDYAGANIVTDHDNGLTALDRRGLSHISFCYIPGAPVVNIEKECTGKGDVVDGDKLRYTYDVTISNDSTGAFTLENFRLTDDPAAGINYCKVTKIGNNNVSIVLNDTTPTAIDNGNTYSLTTGNSLMVEVQCLSHAGQTGNGPNMITVLADVAGSSDTVDDKFTEEACGFEIEPMLTIDKICSDPPVRLMSEHADGSGGLMVEACVEIEVNNVGIEDVANVRVVDDILGLDVNVGTLQAGGSPWNSGKICYQPQAENSNLMHDLDSGGQAIMDKFLVWSAGMNGDGSYFLSALFNNIASVSGDGVLSGGEAFEEAEALCTICWDQGGEGGMACPNPADFSPMQ